MSIIESNPCDGNRDLPAQDAHVKLLIVPKEKDIGGFSVRRSLPDACQRMIGPWIFFDHMGPATFKPNDGLDVRPHPHINLATVTYLFEGAIMHRDSLGTKQRITPGAVNLMVAGKGITHSERTPDDLRAQGHTVQGLQLWLALPEADEQMAPAFFHYDKSALPMIVHDDKRIRLVIGEGFGAKSPVNTYSDTFFADVLLNKDAQLTIPEHEQRGVYVVEGSASIGDQTLQAHEFAVLAPDESVRIHAQSDCRIILIGGASLGNRHIWWNFVSSRKERIEQAKSAWQRGEFPAIDGDDDERIPLPDK